MILFFFLLIFIFGWLFVGLLVQHFTFEENVGLSFLIGFGIHSVVYAIIIRLLFYTPNNLLVLVIEIGVCISVYFLRGKRIKVPTFYKGEKKYKLISILLVLISSVILLYSFIQSIYWPVFEPDAISLYDFRAQLLLHGDVMSFYKGLSFYQNYLYPPFTSLMHFFIYQSSNFNPKIVYPVILTAFYLVIVGYTKRITNSKISGLIAGLLVLLTPSVLWNSFIALPNIIYMCFISSACLYLFENISEKKLKTGQFIIGVILLSISIWTRSEPFWIVIIFMFVIFMIIKKQILPILISLAIIVSMSYLWTGSQITLASEPSLSTSPVVLVQREMNGVKIQNISKSFEVIKYFSKPIYDAWGPIPIFFMVFIIIELFISVKYLSMLQIVTTVLSLSILVGIINFSYRFPFWRELESSTFRMAIMVVPLFWVSMMTSVIWKNIGRAN